MAQQVKAFANGLLTTWALSLGPISWKERTNSTGSSDLHMHTMACVHVPAHIYTQLKHLKFNNQENGLRKEGNKD